MIRSENQAPWSPPRELARSSREVELSPAGVGVTILAVLFFIGSLAALIGFTTVAQRSVAQRDRLRAEGLDAQAEVTRLWRTGGEDNQDMAAYRFTWEDRTYTGRSPLPRRVWKTLTVGSPLPIRLLPADPSHSRPAAVAAKTTPFAIGPIVSVLLALVAMLMLFIIRKQRRLLSEGRPAAAVVTRYTRGEHGKHVHYQFTILSGAVVKGSYGCGRKAPAVGATICILYDRDNPRRNSPYPLGTVRLAAR